MLRERAYEQIRQDIIKLRFAPGEALVETDLAQRYKTSKTPVREALTSLQRDNLVEYRPNKGFTVAPISIQDIHEIFEARVFIESALMRLAVRHINDEEIRKLEGLAEVTYDKGDPESIEPYMQANIDFHMLVAHASRNGRLCGYYRNLLDEAQRLLYMDVKQHDIQTTWHTSHGRFVNALKRRDEDEGARAVEEVTANAKKRFLNL